MREAGIAAETIVAVRFRVACHIEPVAAPALAKLRAVEQAVHQGRQVGRHRLIQRWRQAGEVKVEPANKHRSRCVRCWRQAMRFHLCQHKAVDAVTRPVASFHCGRLGIGDGLIRPQGRLVLCHGLRGALRQVRPRIRSAHLHPGDEIMHHGLGQALLWRHFEAVVAQGLDDEAVIRLARNQGRSGLSASDHFRGRIQQQFASQFL